VAELQGDRVSGRGWFLGDELDEIATGEVSSKTATIAWPMSVGGWVNEMPP
jgi:hypothetical protein